MANPVIQIRRSAVSGRIPSTTQLSAGEFAINTYDGKIFIKQDQGGVGVGTTIIVVNPWSVGTGTNTYNTYFTAGSVGIATTNPTSTLHVVGNALITGIVTTSSLNGYQNLVGATSSETKTFTVIVASKTTNHRYYGTGSGSAYFIDGAESPFITLLPGKTYRFNQEDSSNSTHPLRFYLESNKTTQYSTNVTTNGTPGSVGAYTEIVITDATPIVLHYQCSAHAYMGNAVSVNSNFVDTPYQITARSGINATGVVTATSFSGSLSGNVTGDLIGNVNSSGVSTFTNLLVGTGVTINSGIVSATTFSGNLSGNAAGLSGTPNITVGSVTSGNINSSGIVTASSVIVGTAVTIRSTGINATGVITATSFVGSGSLLTGIVTSLTAGSGISINQSTGNVTITATGGGGGGFFVQNSAGIHTLSNVGVGTTNPTASVTSTNTAILAAGIVTAYKFYGDGSNLTGIVAASGIATVAIGTIAPSSPSAGDMWYNSNLGRTFIYYNDGDSSQWVDSAPFNIPQASTLTPGRTDTNFTATAGQTTFTVSYTVGYIDVYLNGVRLTGTEYVANNGTSVILAEGAAAGDIISVVELRTGIGATGPAGAQATASLTIATRAGVFTQNAVGAGITIALRSGVGTASF